MSHQFRRAPTAFAFGLGLNALLLTTSLSAPLTAQPLTPINGVPRAPIDFPPNPLALQLKAAAATSAKPSIPLQLKKPHLRKHHRKTKHKHRAKRRSLRHAPPAAFNAPNASLAASLPPPPSFAGAYGGVVGGAQWLRQTKKIEVFGSLAPFQRNSRVAGAIWGLAGYNFQKGALIAGVEGSIGYANIDASQNPSPYGALAPLRDGADGSFRTRFGVEIFDRAMIFGSSGLTLGSVNGNRRLSSGDSLTLGWTAGGGLEWLIAPNVSWRGEYLFTQFPRPRIDGHAIRTGFSVKF